MAKSAYQRILLKLSGEALMGKQKFGFEKEACQTIAENIRDIYRMGIQVGVVVGGGNIFRGIQAKEFGFARTPADHVGMLATTLNGLILDQCLENLGVNCHVMSALSADEVVDPYSWPQAMKHLQNGDVVIFVGGTGSPYFTTDTAAALRASEIEAEVLIKATKVDGIYDRDPLRYSSAKKFPKLTYTEVLTKKLSVMDATAIALCRENGIPIHVINLFKKGSLLSAVREKKGGTLVSGE
ncbi:MAG: UMP kinase [Verrucomicrobia bacterium]|nr:UMP kinase [Verrucomicrobiota bacterium]